VALCTSFEQSGLGNGLDKRPAAQEPASASRGRQIAKDASAAQRRSAIRGLDAAATTRTVAGSLARGRGARGRLRGQIGLNWLAYGVCMFRLGSLLGGTFSVLSITALVLVWSSTTVHAAGNYQLCQGPDPLGAYHCYSVYQKYTGNNSDELGGCLLNV
jgi:hypothetical protein